MKSDGLCRTEDAVKSAMILLNGGTYSRPGGLPLLIICTLDTSCVIFHAAIMPPQHEGNCWAVVGEVDQLHCLYVNSVLSNGQMCYNYSDSAKNKNVVSALCKADLKCSVWWMRISLLFFLKAYYLFPATSGGGWKSHYRGFNVGLSQW